MIAASPSVRMYAIAIAIILLLIVALVRCAKLCLCDNCKDPYAVFGVGDLQFCRQCFFPWRRHQRKVGRRRSLLRRIFRAAA